MELNIRAIRANLANKNEDIKGLIQKHNML